MKTMHTILSKRLRSIKSACLAGAVTAFMVPISAQALTINAVFEPGLSTAAEAVINAAIGFYQNTFADPITVKIDFHDMSSGLGASLTDGYFESYTSFRTALINDATSVDDMTAKPSYSANGGMDPVLGNSDIIIKPANGRAIGLNTPGVTYTSGNTGGFCAGTNLDGCVGLNVGLTTTGGGTYSLLAVVEHEIDEVLGLGSSLSADGTIWAGLISPEDLFRYSSNGVRNFALNATCPGSNAYFSIDQGATDLNQFYNCSGGPDYGDWVTHTPTQVQDAVTNGSGSPSLTVSSAEVRALDVIGYTLRQQQTPLPEPVSVALFGIGLASMAMTRRRAQRKTNK